MIRRLVLLVVSTLAVQAPGKEEDSDFLVRQWQSEDGLPGNIARSIGQTPDGYLWIATAEGIARFDGIEFEMIPATGEWQGRPLDYSRVFTPEDGSLWVATNRHGLFHLGNDGLECAIADFEGTEEGTVTHLFTLGSVTYFIRNDNVWRMEDGGERKAVMTPAVEEAADKARREALDRGRMSVNPDRLVDRAGGTWEIAGRKILHRPPGPAGAPAAEHTFEEAFPVTDMLEGREGNLWLASPVEGLVQVRHRRVVKLESPEGPYIHAVNTGFQDRNGDWWISNRNGFVDRIRGGSISHHLLATKEIPRPVSCIFEDSRGRMWFGLRDASLMEWDTAVGDFEGRFTDIPEFSKINAIAEDASGRLWFAGGRGLFRWDGTTVESFGADPAVAGASFTALAIAPEGTLYLGTMKGRVFSYDGSRFLAVGDFSEHPRNWVSSIVPGAAGELWVSTIGAGLFLRQNGAWHRFATAEGLPDERITALTLEGDGSLWMGSLGGILRASREELLEHASDPGAPAPHWIQLGRSDGLSPRECVGGVQPGVIRDRAGTLWFPTMGGLAGVDPTRIPADSPPPILHMKQVTVDGVPVPFHNEPVVAGPGRSRVGFSFTGISLSAPEHVSYRVQLEGLEDQPQSVGDERRITYQAVPPGRYRFRVSAVNGDGVRTPRAVTVPIVIRPRFWETVWFSAVTTLAVLLVTLGTGWLIARRRMRRRFRELRMRSMLEDERSRIARDLHDELGASLTELSILSALAHEDRNDETLRPALEQLTAKAQQAVGGLDEIVWATNPSQDSLRSLVEYLDFFAHEFLKTVHVPLQIDIAPSVPDVAIGPRRRHNVLMAAREAINNAVKHGRPGFLLLEVTMEADHLVVRITDDGAGFDVEYAASGDGLTNLRKRMTDSGGDCEIHSRRGEGTTVTLRLPVPTDTSS